MLKEKDTHDMDSVSKKNVKRRKETMKEAKKEK